MACVVPVSLRPFTRWPKSQWTLRSRFQTHRKTQIRMDGRKNTQRYWKNTQQNPNNSSFYSKLISLLFQYRRTLWWRWKQHFCPAVFPVTTHIQTGAFLTSVASSAACDDPHYGQRGDISGFARSVHFHRQCTGNELVRGQVYIRGWGWGKSYGASKFWRLVLGLSHCVPGKGTLEIEAASVERLYWRCTRKALEVRLRNRHKENMKIFCS